MYWLAASILALLVTWGFLEARFACTIKRYSLGSRGLRIVFISDIHCGRWYHPKRLETLIKQVSGLSADMVLLGGDYVDHGVPYVEPCIRMLSRLSPAAAVLGNHDVQFRKSVSPRSSVVESFRNCRIPLLCNSDLSLTVKGITIQVAGPVDARRDIAYLGHIRRNPNADILLLLSHNPDFIPTGAGHLPFDIALCGHTHGGQVTFFGKPITTHSIYKKELGRGLCRWAGKPVVVSNGVGTTIIPLRFFASPSIEVIDL